MNRKPKEVFSLRDRSLDSLQALLQRWDQPEAEKVVQDLSVKETSGELTLAFCGHFSAGKSSMINELCGSRVLPSGPVPTSSNVVSIRSGQPRIVLHPQGGAQPQELHTASPEAAAQRLQAYCRSGEEYAAIDIWAPIPLLGPSGVLMDTPGVDSTDDGHRAATHSALHLADVVFYVMDYNHVQSENNLAFAKTLSDWGKPLYLIINQIDKHREDEIPIREYRRQVESAFDAWGVRTAGILYTSLKRKDHPLNQWDTLLQIISQLLKVKDELLQFSISASAHHLGDAVLSEIDGESRDEREAWQEASGGESEAVLEQKLRSLNEEQALLGEMPEQARAALRGALDALLGSGNLMPADVREAAGAYIDSRSPGFRGGLFATATKREKEREKRLAAWHRLQRREIEAQLEWHLLTAVRQWAEGLELWEEGAEQALKDGLPAYTPELLAAAVKPETGGTGDALLNFCRMLAAEIKAAYRRAALAFGDTLLAQQLPPLLAARGAELAQREAALRRQAGAAAALAAAARAAAARAQELAAQLPPLLALAPGLLPGAGDPPDAAAASAASQARPPQAAAAGSAAPGWGAATSPAGGRRRLGEAAAVLQAAAEALRGEPAMASAARSLAARAESLAAGRFTLALFGAFSAGKSSFANALLGEEVLPVSPHPATAAVGRILAPEGEYAHGMAVVRLKTREEAWEDILHAFGVLQLPEPQPQTWIRAAESLATAHTHPSALPHAGFLRAAARGWAEAEPQLGTVQTVGLAEYRRYAAEESLSCYVQGIDLYYDCPLTAAGIVLVDTPGADSLHARHTGVTFGYMKNADAICFVTYYNHAFSKADRSLLAQLGRIKDSFTLDKMFFVVNASDLAADEAELAEVTGHVASNLRANGLPNPRIFPLSSLLGLQGKTQNDRGHYEASRLGIFESALAEYAGGELPRLALASAKESLDSAVQRAEEWRQLALMEGDRRLEEEGRFQAKRSRAELRLAALPQEDRPQRELRREGEELLYHVRQRIGFTLGRFFQESFHPSLLREENGKLKEAFTACGRELERFIQRELEQEWWATTLRLEAAGRRFADTAAASAAAELDIPLRELGLQAGAEQRWPAPDTLSGRLEPLDWAGLWSHFKSPRHFFEGQGRTDLRAEAEPLLKEAVAKASSVQEEALLAFYAASLRTALADAASRLHEALAEEEEALNALAKGGDAAQHWQSLAAELQRQEQAFQNMMNLEV